MLPANGISFSHECTNDFLYLPDSWCTQWILFIRVFVANAFSEGQFKVSHFWLQEGKWNSTAVNIRDHHAAWLLMSYFDFFFAAIQHTLLHVRIRMTKLHSTNLARGGTNYENICQNTICNDPGHSCLYPFVIFRNNSVCRILILRMPGKLRSFFLSKN